MDATSPITISPSSAAEGEMPCYWTQDFMGEGYAPIGKVDALLRWSVNERWLQMIRSDTEEVVFSITFDDLTFFQTLSDRIEFDIQKHHYVVMPAGFKKSWANFGARGIWVAAGMVNSQYEKDTGFDKLAAALKQAGKYRSAFQPRQIVFAIIIGFLGAIAVLVIGTLIAAKLSH